MTIPTTIGRYEIKKELGQGGMATVFLAHDPRFERDVALKVLPHAFLHDPSFRLRFEREAKTVASLEHKAIVPVYDFGEHGGQPYLVMRHMGGGSLIERLRQGPIHLEEAARIVGRLASALDKAHKAGIVHRDLKPGNILFDESGDAYLADFGIVKLLEGNEALTNTGGVIGTPAYMSPEQARGLQDIDGRSDIYALGAILFEMLTGKLPYYSETPMGLVVKHIMEPVPRILESNPHLPIDVQGIIGHSMAKERDERFKTGEQMALALNEIDFSVADSTAFQTIVEPLEPPAVSANVGASQPTIVEPWREQPVAAAPAVVPTATVVQAEEPMKAAVPETAVSPSSTKRSLKPIWFVAGIVALALLFFGGRALLNRGKDAPPTTASGAVSGAMPEAMTGLIDSCANIPPPTQSDVMVRFVNESSFSGVGLWQDSSQSPAQLLEYFQVAEGDTFDQETFQGDKWVVQEPSGGTLLEYTASDEEEQCVLVKRPLGNLWINFINQSGVPAVGYLVDSDGVEEAYFLVGATGTNGLWSAVGNIWRVRDGSGNVLLEYSSTTAAEQQVLIPPR